MFDTLTLIQLYRLHTSLHDQTVSLNATIMDSDYNPIVSALSPQWAIVTAKCDEILETMNEVYAEIGRREQEESAGTRVLRDLRNARGIDV